MIHTPFKLSVRQADLGPFASTPGLQMFRGSCGCGVFWTYGLGSTAEGSGLKRGWA